MSKNKFDISGRVAVVTGGGGVLGSSIAKSLLEAGVKVVILDIRKEALDNRIAELKETGDEIIGLECNVLDKESLVSVREMILQKWGSIDILLNIAGGNMPGLRLLKIRLSSI